VLTVDLDLLELGAGDLILDLGCGGGRHGYGCRARGAAVVALDADRSELDRVAAMFAALAGLDQSPRTTGSRLSRDSPDAVDSAAPTCQRETTFRAEPLGPLLDPPDSFQTPGSRREAGRPDEMWSASRATRAGARSESVGAVALGDALALPFPDACFDRIIAAEILEHIPDDRLAIAELARVLRPGGIVAVTVPRYGPELVNWLLSREYHSVAGGHIRIYRRSQLIARLESSGLVLRTSHHAHALHAPYWWLRCLIGLERETNVAVRAYRGLLENQIEHPRRSLSVLEELLNPLIGKSLVVYLERPL
jgi:SAM-dependent methyltransferase